MRRVDVSDDPLSEIWSLPVAQHLGAIAALTALMVVRWWIYFTWPMPLNDEMTYFRAATSLAGGHSPYRPGYLYPMLPAILSVAAIRHLGVAGWTLMLRLLNDIGGATIAWLSVCWLSWRWWKRLALGAALAVLSPIVHFAIFTANISLFVGALVTIGLLTWPRRPATGGLLLGLSVGLKPFAPGAIAALGLHRPQDKHRLGAWISAGIAAAVGAVLLAGIPGSSQLFRLHIDRMDPLARTVSLHRFAHLLGWGDHLLLVSVVLLGIALWLIRRGPLNVGELYAAATATALATTPIVWAHTMIITLPVQVLAMTRSIHRLRQATESGLTRRRRYESIFVLLACAAIQFSTGAGAVYGGPVLWQAAAVLPPTLAPACLAIYLVRTRNSGLGTTTAAAVHSERGVAP
jgi:hypothetical protein